MDLLTDMVRVSRFLSFENSTPKASSLEQDQREPCVTERTHDRVDSTIAYLYSKSFFSTKRFYQMVLFQFTKNNQHPFPAHRLVATEDDLHSP